MIEIAGCEYYLYSNDVLNVDGMNNKQIKSVLFVLHGRNATHEEVGEFCKGVLVGVKEKIDMVVTFDNPNHGKRQVNAIKNLTWGEGNFTHAMDMYSQMNSTVDSIISGIDFIPSYLRVPPFGEFPTFDDGNLNFFLWSGWEVK